MPCSDTGHLTQTLVRLARQTTSIISLSLNTLSIGTFFSKRSTAQSTFSGTVPPLIWISIMCDFFAVMAILLICVCAMTRTTEARFLKVVKRRSIPLRDLSLAHFFAYLVYAFFLARYQFL